MEVWGGYISSPGSCFHELIHVVFGVVYGRFIIDLPKSENDRECCFLAVAVSQILSAIGNARAWKYGVGIFRPQGHFLMRFENSRFCSLLLGRLN